MIVNFEVVLEDNISKENIHKVVNFDRGIYLAIPQ